MKIRTLNELSDRLDGEFAWRLKELADLKVLVRNAENLIQSSMVRAGLPLAYAHWEGFVKSSAQFYLNFVLMQKHDLKSLSSSFLALSAQKILNTFTQTNRTLLQLELVDHLTSSTSLNAVASYSTTINTKANLNSAVFTDISLMIGVDLTPYETKFKFIDESLLKRRNEIAHGNYLDIDAKAFREIVDEVIVLLRQFKNDLLNNASQRKYLK
ncbi:MAG: hypothetical protein EOO06_15905 [Chitinophagaceae bacterium]|nr:MAG: hypothetical protein EOO06_15905 [Chitinophagaceae bacterium]